MDPIQATEVVLTIAALDRAIKRAFPHDQRIFIEVETWQAKDEAEKIKR